MTTSPVTLVPYNGALTSLTLLSSNPTILLGSFGSATSGTITDADGLLTVGSHTTIGSTTYTVLGSGWVQPGVSVLGVIVPTGTRVDVIVLSDDATGKVVLAYPDGTPSLLGAVALVTGISAVGYDLDTKSSLCFLAGTEIRGPEGWRRVEELRAGDRVLDAAGEVRRVVLAVSTQLPELTDATRPIEIRGEVLGQPPGSPCLRVSPQHRVALVLDGAEVLVPAKALLGTRGVRMMRGRRTAHYVHLLCDRHALLVTPAGAAESLLLGSQATRTLGPAQAAEARAALHPTSDIARGQTVTPARPCLPVGVARGRLGLPRRTAG